MAAGAEGHFIGHVSHRLRLLTATRSLGKQAAQRWARVATSKHFETESGFLFHLSQRAPWGNEAFTPNLGSAPPASLTPSHVSLQSLGSGHTGCSPLPVPTLLRWGFPGDPNKRVPLPDPRLSLCSIVLFPALSYLFVSLSPTDRLQNSTRVRNRPRFCPSYILSARHTVGVH